MPDQTRKKPTGKFDRQSLKEYLKKQAKESKVGEDYIQFIRKVRPEQQQSSSSSTASKKTAVLPSEFDEVLDSLTEEEIAELASASSYHFFSLYYSLLFSLIGELGMHGLINQAQSRGDDGASAKIVAAQTC